MSLSPSNPEVIESDIPARLDRLPWSKFHWLIVIALGITWILDGLEVTLAGALGGVLRRPDALGLTAAQVGASATCYLVGAVVGAVVFGYLTDRLGRKRLFTVTLLLYLTATALTACSWSFASYAIFRALTGAGIGGEYSAINSAIDELIPARLRGRVDLIINASFWIGAAIGAAATIVLLDMGIVPISLGWRLAFGIGAILGLGIIFLRHAVPESPRWLMIHGHAVEAELIVAGIEKKVTGHRLPEPPQDETIRILPRTHTPFLEIWDAIAIKHRRRSLLALALMASQAFFYNAIFFTYALVLVTFYNLPAQKVGLYLFPFAIGNFLGPLFLGHLFDVIGRKKMITFTYRNVRHPSGRERLDVPTGHAHRHHASHCLVSDFLFRFIRCQFGLSHSQRNLSAGDTRISHRYLLCLRHAGRGSGSAIYFWAAHPERIPHSLALWIPGRSCADDRRRRGGGIGGSGC